MSLSEVDRALLQRCLDRQSRAWPDFVDRFVGLVVHVVHRTAMGRGITINEATRDDLVAEVFLVLIRHDFAVLRRFRQHCSLATYLTVVARRVVVRQLMNLLDENPATLAAGMNGSAGHDPVDQGSEDMMKRIENAEEVEHLIMRLDPREANVVRMFHLEGKSYQEISQAVGVHENSIGPMLSRARGKMNS